MPVFDFIVVGAGIFGVTTAIELQKRRFRVALLEQGPVPHPLAASTDISKIVRMEYGADEEYMDMVDEAFAGWKQWNDFFQQTLYHEVGFLMLCKHPLAAGKNTFEAASYHNLIKRGYSPQRLDAGMLERKFGAFRPGTYAEAIFNSRAGYAESGRVVEVLVDYARQLGVTVLTNHTVQTLELQNGNLTAIRTQEGVRLQAGHVVICAGAYTPLLLPELQSFMRVTGHPVFHIRPENPGAFAPPYFSVFTADISNTGWYGFPLHPREGVVKIANHGAGQVLHPEKDPRIVSTADEQELRSFLRESIPELADAPVVYTRRCLYNDTLDGHFWIDRHPEIKGVTVAAGGSGHGFKMAPILGEMIAAVVTGGRHKWSARYGWRKLDTGTRQEEEARFKPPADA
ncbi:MAG: FAD-dependent oxidoreductase [Bacteroidetes bacterium]|nr:MAG: FAD-dependent oxidoreductase [Bacteroidota bacterium]